MNRISNNRLFGRLLTLVLLCFSLGSLHAQWNSIYSYKWFANLEAMDDTTWYLSRRAEILKTTDAGHSWTVEIPNMNYDRLEGMYFMNQNRYWFCGSAYIGAFYYGRVTYTTNGGQNYNTYTTPNQEMGLQDIWFTTNNNGVAVGLSGKIYRSTTGGSAFTQVEPGNGQPLMDVAFANANTGFTVGSAGTGYKTTDGGATWTSTPIPSTGNFMAVEMVSAQTYIAAGSDGIYRTTNGGANWTQVQTGQINRLDFPTASNGYATGNGTMYKTTDGGQTWIGVHVPTEFPITGVIFDANDQGVIMDNYEVYETGSPTWYCPQLNMPAMLYPCTDTAQLDPMPSADNAYQYSWSPAQNLSNANIENPQAYNPTPGQSNSLTFAVTLTDNILGCPSVSDTVTVVFDTTGFVPTFTQPTTIITFCAGTEAVIDAGPGAQTYQWLQPWGAFASYGQSVEFPTGDQWGMNVTECNGTVHMYIVLAQPQFDCDSVWPGDAGYDGVANMYDLLNLGIAFDSTGAARTNPTINWVPEYCAPWSNNFQIIGTNYKHADCNGNGIVGFSDTTAIVQNYGLVHQIFPLGGPSFGPNDPPLYFGPAPGNIIPGSAVTLPIYLGNQSIPMNNFYGGAFSVLYDSIYIKPGSVHVTFNPTWVGNPGSTLLTLGHNLPTDQQIDIALARTNHVNISGYGEIAQLSFVMQDDISALVNEQLLLVNALTSLQFANTKFINNQENPLEVNPMPVDISIILGEENQVANAVKVFPNPAAGQVMIQMNDAMQEIRIVDLTGKIVWQQSMDASQLTISLNGINAGVYMLEIYTHDGSRYTQKLVIQ